MKKRGGSFKIEVYSVKWMDENRAYGQQTCSHKSLEMVKQHFLKLGYEQVSSLDIRRIRIGGELVKLCRQPKTFMVLLDMKRVTRASYMRWYGLTEEQMVR